MGITEFLATYITAFIDKTGYISVYLMMTCESMVVPLPSEAVMPFAGFLIEMGRFTFPIVILISTAGSITGSIVSYYIGALGGEPLINKFGKWVLLDRNDLEAAKKFFNRFGEITIFISRFIPVVRHLISIPAGFGRMNLTRFCIYTLIGAGIWNTFLAYVGYVMKQNWSIVMKYSSTIDKIVVVILAGMAFYFVFKHLQRRKLVKR
jgi:membrane protein DedA with SNARE-associated domain